MPWLTSSKADAVLLSLKEICQEIRATDPTIKNIKYSYCGSGGDVDDIYFHQDLNLDEKLFIKLEDCLYKLLPRHFEDDAGGKGEINITIDDGMRISVTIEHQYNIRTVEYDHEHLQC